MAKIKRLSAIPSDTNIRHCLDLLGALGAYLFAIVPGIAFTESLLSLISWTRRARGLHDLIVGAAGQTPGLAGPRRGDRCASLTLSFRDSV